MKQFLEKYYHLFGGNNIIVTFLHFDINNMKNIRKVITIETTTTFYELKELLRKEFKLSTDFSIQFLSGNIPNNSVDIQNVIDNINEICNRCTYIINENL